MYEAKGMFENALLMLDRVAALRFMQEAASRMGVLLSVEKLIVPALENIGRGWEEGRLALSQVYMSGRICEELIDTILPIGNLGQNPGPRIAITVFEDYHMLGKRLVYSVLRATGHDLLDYGRTDLESALRRVTEDGIQILFLSVLMLPSALRIEELKKHFNHAGLPTKIAVGGAPFRFDKKLWRDVGADAMGRTASDAIGILHRLSGGAV